MCQNLNTLKNTWASWLYSITIDDDFSPSLLSLGFCGIGRWSFHASLKLLDEWTCEEFQQKPLLAAAHLTLTGAMEQHGSQIEFVYADEEAGSLYISTDAVKFAAKDGHLIIEQSIEKGHEYTWENYLALDFGGEEQLAELVDGLLKLLTADMALREASYDHVEEWAKENTLPHATADRMGEEKTAKFKAAFQDILSPV